MSTPTGPQRPDWISLAIMAVGTLAIGYLLVCIAWDIDPVGWFW